MHKSTLSSGANPSTLAKHPFRDASWTTATQRRFYHANFQRYIIAGLLTITPLFAVWLVFNFFLNTLSFFGQPLAVPLTEFLDQNMPAVRPWIGQCDGALADGGDRRACWRSISSARSPRA